MAPLIPLLFLVGCDATVQPGAPLPPPIELTVGPLVPGEPVTLDVVGAPPGSPVWFLRGQPGAAACPPILGGACLGLAGPSPLRAVTANAAGEASFAATLPPSVPLGLEVAFQAVVLAGPELSDVVERTVTSSWGLLSDDFEDGALSSDWQIINGQSFDAVVAGGQLQLTALGQSLWFNDSQGPLLYKEVTGDFRVTAMVEIGRASDFTQIPTESVQLGGLMVRAPAPVPGVPGQEDYVFEVLGLGVNGALTVETKTTEQGSSVFQNPPWPAPGAELRLCRQGDDIHLYNRLPGDPWLLNQSYQRPDLPPRVQVGTVIYANLGTPDLQFRFDRVIFEPVDGAPDACTRP